MCSNGLDKNDGAFSCHLHVALRNKHVDSSASILPGVYLNHSRPVSGDGVIDLSLEFGEMVDPSKESNKHGSGHCTKMQAILRQVSDGECVEWFRRVKEMF